MNCYVLEVYSMKIQPCIRNNFNLNWLDDLWKLDERFSAEWAGAPCCLYNLCEKLVWMVHFYGAVLLVASLQKQFSPKPPSVLQTRAYAISWSLKVNWFITPGKCIDWKERSAAAMWQWFGRHRAKDNSHPKRNRQCCKFHPSGLTYRRKTNHSCFSSYTTPCCWKVGVVFAVQGCRS